MKELPELQLPEVQQQKQVEIVNQLLKEKLERQGLFQIKIDQ
jgi:hypothetical protein